MKPTPDPQPELPALAQPTSMVVAGDLLARTVARLQDRGAKVQSIDLVPGRNAEWRLDIVWPRTTAGEPCSCELCVPPTVPSDAAVPLLATQDDL